MIRKTALVRALTGIAAAAAVVAASLIGTNQAQAYSPDPTARIYHRDTGSCPCSGGGLGDPIDGTYFKKDPGGYAVKIELVDSAGRFLGKVEYHPYGEYLWIYDTRNDGDTFYVQLTRRINGEKSSVFWMPPSTSRTVDTRVANLDHPEGKFIDIKVYDRHDDSGLADLIADTYAFA